MHPTLVLKSVDKRYLTQLSTKTAYINQPFTRKRFKKYQTQRNNSEQWIKSRLWYIYFFRSRGEGGGVKVCTRIKYVHFPSEYKTDKKWSHHYVTFCFLIEKNQLKRRLCIFLQCCYLKSSYPALITKESILLFEWIILEFHVLFKVSRSLVIKNIKYIINIYIK